MSIKKTKLYITAKTEYIYTYLYCTKLHTKTKLISNIFCHIQNMAAQNEQIMQDFQTHLGPLNFTN